jgi:hypothetical protein
MTPIRRPALVLLAPATQPATVPTDTADAGQDVELPGELAPAAAQYVMACGACRLSGGPYSTPAEALVLAGEHDRIHHRGVRTAEASDRYWCESCRLRPARATWPPTPTDAASTTAAGEVPFRVCHDCAHTGAPSPTGHRHSPASPSHTNGSEPTS